MNPEDVFLGPILRRAEESSVLVCLATFKPFDLRFSVRLASGGPWLAHGDDPLTIEVSDELFFYFGRIRPAAGQPPLPTGTLLAYSVAVRTATADDYAPFERIVAADALAYPPHTLPTFALQRRGRPLQLLYGSCRKIHNTDGGRLDALSLGDGLIARAPSRVDERPSMLVLGGDQIYADEVDPAVFQQVLGVAGRLEGSTTERLPGPTLPADREEVLKKAARFTSDDLKTHLATFAEYLALYGLSWNARNWRRAPRELDHFTSTLPGVRRLLANVPTYMLFDDHDVTDDWNLSLEWQEAVRASPLGRRIIANALMAYWLCQGYGNDPDAVDAQRTSDLASLIKDRHTRYAAAERAFWDFDRWEFSTPSTPFVYFLDTRTQRGPKDDPGGTSKGAPAFLKSVRSWQATMARLQPLLRQQAQRDPVVLVAATPVFGFEWIDFFQKLVSFLFGAYKFDYESWAANEAQMTHVLGLLSGRNVVLLSGDVHYGYTSTVSYTVFDSARSRSGAPARTPTGGLPTVPSGARPSYRPVATAQVLQLTSSALKNYASDVFTGWPAAWSSTGPGTIVTEDGSVLDGHYENGRFVVLEFEVEDPTGIGGLTTRRRHVLRSPQDVRPVTAFRQRVNDQYNSRYLGQHNLGVVTIHGPTVRLWFATPRGKVSERTFDFGNPRYFS